ncbi:hypothetical protein FRC03_011496 [Tulasnella sp. 419]|nr:hypothetical protein FRC03_011496 [Tulasnella sp. 419]
MPAKDTKVMGKLAKLAVKDKLLSQAPFRNDFRQAIQRGSLWRDFYPAYPTRILYITWVAWHYFLGMIVRMDKLSHDRSKGVSGKPEHAPAIPPMTRKVMEVTPTVSSKS